MNKWYAILAIIAILAITVNDSYKTYSENNMTYQLKKDSLDRVEKIIKFDTTKVVH